MKPAIILVVTVLGIVLLSVGRARVNQSPMSLQVNGGGGGTPLPTEEDVVGDRRGTAEAIAGNAPENQGVEVLTTIKEMLASEDAYVRQMGTTSISRIAGAGAAQQSGIRTLAQNDTELRQLLISNGSYHHESDRADREVRSEAILSLGALYIENPSAEIETALANLYSNETNKEVRGAIIYAIGMHEYESQATRDVLTDAAEDYDPALAQTAQALLDRLNP